MSSKKYLKMVVAGEGGIGKTALIETYRNGMFKDGTTMTIAVQFHVINVRILNEDVTLQIWDLGGQRRYFDMGIFKRYCDEAQVAIICFDLSDLATLEEVPKWTDLLPPGIPKILVGTKRDLATEDFSIQDLVEDYIDNLNFVNFVPTSSKTNPRSIKLVFEDLMLATVLSDDSSSYSDSQWRYLEDIRS
ncbi:MAG: Rab family GTPase [Candidatus Hodarchaeota archaeon]